MRVYDRWFTVHAIDNEATPRMNIGLYIPTIGSRMDEGSRLDTLHDELLSISNQRLWVWSPKFVTLGSGAPKSLEVWSQKKDVGGSSTVGNGHCLSIM